VCDDRRRRRAERNFPILAHEPRISPFFGKEEWVILFSEFARVCRREFFRVDLVFSATRTDSAQPPLPGATMDVMMLGLLGALNICVTLGLANTILTFGGVVLNLNIVVN
jgi:hypothetical protein